MANTVNILGFANTFGDWVVATNADSNEINSIGKYDWTKDSGTLFLNGTGTSLSVGNNAIISGQLQITGTSSSASIDNNLTVGKQVYFTNTSQSLVASGTINSNGTIYATNTGTSLSVSNNSTLGGTLTVSGSTIISNTINVLGATTLQNSLSVGAGALITGNVSITANTFTSFLTANNRINAGQLTVTSNGNFGGSIIASTSAVVNGYDIISYILGSFNQANASYGSQNVTGTYANSAYFTANSAQLYANSAFLRANAAYGSQNVTGTYANSAYFTANSAQLYANGAFVQANAAYGSQNVTGTYANSAYLAANGANANALTTGTYANSAYSSQNTTGTYANSAFLFANNLQSGAQTHNNMTLTGTSLSATNAVGAFSALTTSGGLTVGGSFTINGTVVYTTNNFVINANTNTPVTSFFSVNRGTANNQPNGIPNANAAIRWNETAKYFDILDVNNGTQHSQIMTANMISDSTSSTSTTTVPTNKNLTGAFTQANAAFLQANSAYGSQNVTGSYANSAFVAANTADSKAVTAGSYANSAFTTANTTNTNQAAINLTQNTSITAAFTQANTGVTNAATADSKAVTAGSYANSAFTQANTGVTDAATADSKAVTAGSYANSAFTTANNALPKTGGTLTGDLGVTGNLFVNGTTSFINVATFQTVDSLIKLAANNLSDTIDIGFYGQYVSVGTKYTGLVRTAASSYYLFQGITSDPTSNSVGAITFANYGTLNANIAAGQITSSQPIPVTSGGTGVTTSTGTGSVVLSTNPSLTTPILGTPQSGNLANCTFPTLNQNTSGTAAGLSATLAVASGGTGVTTSTGTGSVVLSTNPSLTTPILGTPQSGTLTNCTFPTLNQNTTGSSGSCTGNAATATSAGTFTSTTQNSQFNSIGIGTAASATAGEIRATNNITAFYSDDRLKTRLGTIEDALAKVKRLSGFYYEPNQTAQDLGYKVIRDVGVSAQQVQAELPEIVVPAPIDEKYWTVRYEKLVPLLIEAIKELSDQVEELKAKLP